MNAQDLIIPLNGLTSSGADLEGKLGKEFFAAFDNRDILDASLDVSVRIRKSGTSISVGCAVSGDITVACDRCMEDLKIPVGFDRHLTVKFSSDGADDTAEEVLVLDESDTDLDLGQFVYDYTMLCLPIRKVHEDGGCNEAVLRILSEGVRIAASEDESQAGSPFAVLKDLYR